MCTGMHHSPASLGSIANLVVFTPVLWTSPNLTPDGTNAAICSMFVSVDHWIHPSVWVILPLRKTTSNSSLQSLWGETSRFMQTNPLQSLCIQVISYNHRICQIGLWGTSTSSALGLSPRGPHRQLFRDLAAVHRFAPGQQARRQV